MSMSIYYFTGTGNSLKISRDLASRFEETQLIPMTAAIRSGVISKTDTIALVFPVYMFGLPRIVSEFINKLSKQMKDKYIIALAVNGGNVAGTLLELSRKLGGKGLKLSAGFSVITPSNFIVEFTVDDDEIKSIFKSSEKKLDEIASVIKSKSIHEIDKGTKKDCVIKTGILNKGLSFVTPFIDIIFKSTESCNGCGICTRVCPVNNIKLKEGTPKWQHGCQQCFGCINNCPQNAIEYLSLSVGKKRYHNPYIKLVDLMNKNK
jgi:ferredoxin